MPPEWVSCPSRHGSHCDANSHSWFAAASLIDAICSSKNRGKRVWAGSATVATMAHRLEPSLPSPVFGSPRYVGQFVFWSAGELADRRGFTVADVIGSEAGPALKKAL